MINFVINFSYILQNLVPADLRGVKFIAYLLSIGEVLQGVNDSFVTWQTSVSEFLKHSSQVIYLERRLNTLYGVGFGNIYISNVSYDVQTYLFNTAEGREETYLFNTVENRENTYIRNDAEVLSTVNFIVNVPVAVTTTDTVIAAQVNKYKRAGTQFSITRY